MIRLPPRAERVEPRDQRADTDRRTGNARGPRRPSRSDRRGWDRSIAAGAWRAPL